jgi:NAD(P)-dependent dehydrogenase (short-subunit alcohol dehydrogenase family)
MKTIVITGSAHGIGYGLAHEFLARGCQVVISGRKPADLESALNKLVALHGPDRAIARRCDVTDFDQLQALWQAAVQQFGAVDVWINNAAISLPAPIFWEQPPQHIEQMIASNLTGLALASRVALAGMIGQGHGQLYNMEGSGSNGAIRPGLTVYGSTKYALRYFTRALMAEVKGTHVQVCTLSPGMVTTDLLLADAKDDPERYARVKPVFNILADKVETVTPWLAEKILANHKNGAEIVWLTTPKIFWRFLTAGIIRRRVLD